MTAASFDRKDSFARRYIETPAGTALAIFASLRAVIDVIVLVTTMSVGRSDSILANVVAAYANTSLTAVALFDVLTAVGLVQLRYRLKGSSLLIILMILNFVGNIIIAFVDASFINPKAESLNIVYLFPFLIYLAEAFYFYNCLKVIRVVDKELTQSEPAQNPVKHALQQFCIVIIVTMGIYKLLSGGAALSFSGLESILKPLGSSGASIDFESIIKNVIASITSLSLVSTASSVADMGIYCSLYFCAKDFDSVHEPYTVTDHTDSGN